VHQLEIKVLNPAMMSVLRAEFWTWDLRTATE